jgi:ferrous iron transport protein A
MVPLDALKPGDRAVVRSIDGEPVVVGRLMEMGLLEGEEVELVAFAPLGDPVEIRLRDYRLSLRRSEAGRVSVEPV